MDWYFQRIQVEPAVIAAVVAAIGVAILMWMPRRRMVRVVEQPATANQKTEGVGK